MRAFVAVALLSGLSFATIVRADDLAVLEACLHLSGIFEDVTNVFGDDHNLDQKLDVMSRSHVDYRYLAPLVATAGGDQSKAVLASFAVEQPKAIVGNIFSFPVEKETAQCKLPGQDKHSCAAVFDLLKKTTSALNAACVNDYQKAMN